MDRQAASPSLSALSQIHLLNVVPSPFAAAAIFTSLIEDEREMMVAAAVAVGMRPWEDGYDDG